MAQIFRSARLPVQQEQENRWLGPDRPLIAHPMLSDEFPGSVSECLGAGVPLVNAPADVKLSTESVRQQRASGLTLHSTLPVASRASVKSPSSSLKTFSQNGPTGIRGIARRPHTCTPTQQTSIQYEVPTLIQGTSPSCTPNHPPQTPCRDPLKRGDVEVSRLKGWGMPSSTGSWSGDEDFFQGQGMEKSAQHARMRETPSGGIKMGKPDNEEGPATTGIGNQLQNTDLSEWWHQWVHRNEHVTQWLDKLEKPFTVPSTERSKILVTRAPDDLSAAWIETQQTAAADQPTRTNSYPARHQPESLTSHSERARSSSEDGLDRQVDYGNATPSGIEPTNLETYQELQSSFHAATHNLNHLAQRCPMSDTAEGVSLSCTEAGLLQHSGVASNQDRQTDTEGSKDVAGNDQVDTPDNWAKVNGSLATPQLTKPRMRGGHEPTPYEDETPLTPLSPDIELHRGPERRRQAKREGKQRCASYYDADIVTFPLNPGRVANGGGVSLSR